MSDELKMPLGGVDARKYAATALALGMVRGVLFDALHGNLDIQGMRHILDVTASARIAAALNCSENELAIDWNDHLTQDEISRIKNGKS